MALVVAVFATYQDMLLAGEGDKKGTYNIIYKEKGEWAQTKWGKVGGRKLR